MPDVSKCVKCFGKGLHKLVKLGQIEARSGSGLEAEVLQRLNRSRLTPGGIVGSLGHIAKV
jgi:hypothetical protein